MENVISTGKPVIISGWRSEGVSLDDNEMEMLFAFIVNGSVVLIKKWAASDMTEQPEKIAATLEHISYGGINGTILKN